MRSGRTTGVDRRVRQRQDRCWPWRSSGCFRTEAAPPARSLLHEREPARRRRSPAPAGPRQGDLDDLPGSARLAQPEPADRPAGRRDPAPRRPAAGGGFAARSSTCSTGPESRTRRSGRTATRTSSPAALRQRAMIALAAGRRPGALLADEPTTALDVTVQARILRLLARLQDERRCRCCLVSHDLRVVSHVADDLVVLYAGRVCETRTDPAGAAAGPRTRTRGPSLRSVPAVRTQYGDRRPTARSAREPAGPAVRLPVPSRGARSPAGAARTTVPAAPGDRRPTGGAACHFAEEVLASDNPAPGQ